MTTSVIVHAHCDPEAKEVKITLHRPNPEDDTDIIIQDGESHQDVVYDDIQITVGEQLKE